MLDKYGVGQDPYCYPGSSTLRNRLDLLDEARLHQAERELSEIAIGNLPLFPPPYDLDRLSPASHRHSSISQRHPIRRPPAYPRRQRLIGNFLLPDLRTR